MATLYVPRPPIDDPWVSQPGTDRQVPPVLMPAGGGFPFKPPYWKYNYDDSAFWLRTSAHIPPLRMPVGGGYPFLPRFWKNNYDDASFWSGTPNRSIPETDELAGGGFPFKPPYWKYNYDDPGFWVGDKTIAQFQGNLLTDLITTTFALQLPVDYFLADNPLNIISDEKTVLGKMFTTRTSKKGYD